MKALLERLREEIGVIALASIVLLGATSVFYAYQVRVLEETNARLDRELARRASGAARPRPELIRASTPAGALEAFYRYFEREERTTDWLAKLYGVATASGVTLRTAEYRVMDGAARLERYQISLPASGGYTQIQAFLEAALAEIPVLSLDQVKFHRQRASDARIEAELVFSLHQAPR